MSYQTGTATGAIDLLDKIRLFAIAEGWTVNRNTILAGSVELCINKGSNYINMKAAENVSLMVNADTDPNKYGIVINGSDGYDGGADWDRQPGYARRDVTPSSTDQYHSLLPFVINFGPFPSYHFFSQNSGDCIYVEVEVATGIYLRMGFGSLDLYDPTEAGGGRFFYATCCEHVTNSLGSSAWLGNDIWQVNYTMEEVPFRASHGNIPSGQGGSALRGAFDTFDNWAGSAAYSTNTPLEQAVCGHRDRALMQAAPNPLNGVGVLIPVTASFNRANQYYHPVGVVPGMRYMDMSRYLPGDEFTFGGDTWKVFPWYNLGGRSYNHGIAYLKVV